MDFFIVVLFIWLLLLSRQVSSLEATISRLKDGKLTDSFANKSKISQTSSTPKVDKIKQYQEELPCKTKADHKKEFKSLEKFFTENLFAKIGAIAIILALGLFLQYAFENGWFNNTAKVIFGYAVSFGFLLAGYKIKTKNTILQQSLLGVGCSGLYCATYAGYNFYHLFPYALSLVIMFASILLTVVISLKYDSKLISILGLFGAYTIPIIMGKEPNFINFLSYLALLNLIGAYVFYKKSWEFVSLLNILASLGFIISLSFTVQSETSTGSFAIYFMLIALIWIIHFIADILKDNTGFKATRFINFISICLISIFLFDSNKQIAGLGFIVIALAYLLPLLAEYLEKTRFAKSSLITESSILGFASLVFSIFLISDDFNSVFSYIALSIAGFSLGYILKKEYLLYTSIIILGISFTSIFTFNNGIYIQNINNYIPIFNIRALSFAIIIAICVFYLLTSKKYDITNRYNFNSIVYSLISLTALTLICSEINDIARLLNEKELFRRSAIANYEHLSYILVLSGFTMNLLRFFYNHYILKMITYGFYGVCLSGLFVLGFDNSGLIIPVLNLRTIVWLSLIALTVKLARKNTEYKVHFTYLALALCSGLIASEAMLFITSQGAEKLAVSASLLIYSITVLFTGLKFKVLELRRFATVLTSLIIAKVFIFDLAFLNELERIVGFAFLGATLLGASHFYNKQK